MFTLQEQEQKKGSQGQNSQNSNHRFVVDFPSQIFEFLPLLHEPDHDTSSSKKHLNNTN